MTRRWRRVTGALAISVIAFSAATARLLIWPDRGMPARVSALVVQRGC